MGGWNLRQMRRTLSQTKPCGRALYERWRKFFNQERDRDEMARRFSSFKETVLSVEENKRSDLPYRLGINQFADGKLAELQGWARQPAGVTQASNPSA